MNKNHIIINIGRQIGSGGHIIARQLASDFNCKFYDKELLQLAARESGFNKKFFEQNDEQCGFFRSIFHIHAPHVGDNSFYADSISQESLFKWQSDAIKKAAEEGSCVFVGRCADYVLRDMKDTINIFITADLEERIQLVCQRSGCDTDTARKLIAHGESKRASYYNFYTGKKWGHSESYDLCVNSSRLGIDATANLLRDFIESLCQSS